MRKIGDIMSFKPSWQVKQKYCYTCGEVFMEDEGMYLRFRDGKSPPDLFFCKEHYHRIPNHIPIEQERRWYDATRKKNIQSDGEKREG